MQNNNIERRFITFETSGVKIEKRKDGDIEIDVLAGYAAVFFDGSDGTRFSPWKDFEERIDEGAFADVLLDDVRGLFNHDANLILGRTKSNTLRLFEDKKGLRYEIDLPDTQTAKDLSISVSRGDVSGSSFAFTVDTEEWSEEGDVFIRTIKKMKRLLDVSPVTYPAYTGTSVSERGLEKARDEFDKAKEKIEKNKVRSTSLRKKHIEILEKL